MAAAAVAREIVAAEEEVLQQVMEIEETIWAKGISEQVPGDAAIMDAHVIQQYLGCLGQPYADGTVRSRRDMFGVCLDRPQRDA